MAQKQVAARTEGDVYQGLFFWRQASALLIPESRVKRVVLEHDDADGVDDVAVFYEEPGVDAGGQLCTADFYQLKYHVDRRDAYSAEALIDPSFIRAKSSLLQRFFNAYSRLELKHTAFRLHLASNWRWKDDDILANSLREYDGALPNSFFTCGPRSRLGKVRESWIKHLKLSDDEFTKFGKTLRFQLDHFGRRYFREMVYERLSNAGLKLPSADYTSSPYESLIQQFIMNSTTSFDRDSFREICVREGLLDKKDRLGSRLLPTIGVRSFLRFAERIEEETASFVCVAEFFDGRHQKNDRSWSHAALKIIDYFNTPGFRAVLRNDEHAILLECHGTLAILAGYELSRNSGAMVFPIQKPQNELWRPNHHTNENDHNLWVLETKDRESKFEDIAVALSVTHEISGDVLRFLDSNNAPKVSHFVNLRPETGVGPYSVKEANHAIKLAANLVSILRKLRTTPAARVHLFSSAPNSLLFIFGQYREAIGRIQLYEYDFGLEKKFTYEPSISLPGNFTNKL